ncbi:MAG: alpha-L-rhamnosidase N-terminal domain-containing protein [Bianqueaceae bacterium]
MEIVSQELTCKPRFHNPSLSIRQMFREKKLARPRYVRREFTAAKEFSKAVLYATALGLYELYINGEKVGDRILSPEWTSYNRRVQYQTYDVTPMLRRGVNTLSARLGNGWYCGMWQFWPQMPHLYGREPLLLAQLEMETEEGRVLVVSDDTGRTDQGSYGFPATGGRFDADGAGL